MIAGLADRFLLAGSRIGTPDPLVTQQEAAGG